jgi:hypothetical protein
MLGGLIVEVEHASQGVEHLIRRTAFSALLQPRVVVDADTGQNGHVLAAQPRRPAEVAGARQAHFVGGNDLLPSAKKVTKSGPHTKRVRNRRSRPQKVDSLDLATTACPIPFAVDPPRSGSGPAAEARLDVSLQVHAQRPASAAVRRRGR